MPVLRRLFAHVAPVGPRIRTALQRSAEARRDCLSMRRLPRAGFPALCRRRFPILAPGVDAFYGTATYVPMADGARYEVSLSRDALIARPANDRARDAVGGWGGN